MYLTYIKVDSPLEINIISAVRDAIQQALSPESLEAADEIIGLVFEDAQRACLALMSDTWKRFKNSTIYQSMIHRLSTLLLDLFQGKKQKKKKKKNSIL